MSKAKQVARLGLDTSGDQTTAAQTVRKPGEYMPDEKQGVAKAKSADAESSPAAGEMTTTRREFLSEAPVDANEPLTLDEWLAVPQLKKTLARTRAFLAGDRVARKDLLEHLGLDHSRQWTDAELWEKLEAKERHLAVQLENLAARDFTVTHEIEPRRQRWIDRKVKERLEWQQLQTLAGGRAADKIKAAEIRRKMSESYAQGQARLFVTEMLLHGSDQCSEGCLTDLEAALKVLGITVEQFSKIEDCYQALQSNLRDVPTLKDIAAKNAAVAEDRQRIDREIEALTRKRLQSRAVANDLHERFCKAKAALLDMGNCTKYCDVRRLMDAAGCTEELYHHAGIKFEEIED